MLFFSSVDGCHIIRFKHRRAKRENTKSCFVFQKNPSPLYIQSIDRNKQLYKKKRERNEDHMSYVCMFIVFFFSFSWVFFTINRTHIRIIINRNKTHMRTNRKYCQSGCCIHTKPNILVLIAY